MAIKNGTLFTLYWNGNKIANGMSSNFSLTMATRDTTSKDSGGWEESGEALRSWSMSFKGRFDPAASGTAFDDLFADVNTRTTRTVKFTTNTSGDKEYSGTAYITKLDNSADMEATMEFSVEFKGTGALAEGTIP